MVSSAGCDLGHTIVSFDLGLAYWGSTCPLLCHVAGDAPRFCRKHREVDTTGDEYCGDDAGPPNGFWHAPQRHA